MNEVEYLEMMQDTSQLVAKEKATKLGDAAVAFSKSSELVNDVEFWRWMGANYPKDLGDSTLIQQATTEKARWLNTQLQGKGYEWDYMVAQRSKPTKLLSRFDAGDCPTQPGIDITESNLIDGSVIETYQNKAYLSSNNPNLHNTPKDAIVVTNKEKVEYAQKLGYKTEEYMDIDEITDIRDARFKQASSGKAYTTYSLQNIAATSAKAGAIGAIIGMGIETINSYRAWKNGEISDGDYLKEVIRAGGDSGVTAGATSAIMIPIQAAITGIGASTLIAIPVTIVLSSKINKIVAPCFGRGEYRKILNEAKYYQMLETVYKDFIEVVEKSAQLYEGYIEQMQSQVIQYMQMKKVSEKMDIQLKNLYDSI